MRHQRISSNLQVLQRSGAPSNTQTERKTDNLLDSTYFYIPAPVASPVKVSALIRSLLSTRCEEDIILAPVKRPTMDTSTIARLISQTLPNAAACRCVQYVPPTISRQRVKRLNSSDLLVSVRHHHLRICCCPLTQLITLNCLSKGLFLNLL